MKFCQWASILTQRLALYLLSAWGQKGWGHLLTARGFGVIACRGGGVGHPRLSNIEFGKADEVEQLVNYTMSVSQSDFES